MANFNININANVQETNNIAGEALTAGDLVYLSSDGKYYKASASLNSKSTTELRLATQDAILNASVTLLVYGYYDYGSPILTAGEKFYVSTAPGDVTDQLYLGTFNVIRYVGTAYDDQTILFNPDQTYLSEDATKINDVPLNFGHVHVESDITDLDKMSTQEILDIQTALTASIRTKDGYDTGLISFGELSINADPTKFDIAFGTGVHNKWDALQPLIEPDIKEISFGPYTSLTVNNLATDPVTYVAIDYNYISQAITVVQQSSPFSNEQRREVIILGVLVHSNNTIIELVSNSTAPVAGVVNQLHDFMEAVGPLNTSGNIFSANGANLGLEKTAGTIFKFGVNYLTNYKDPHVRFIDEEIPATFRYRLRGGIEFSNVTNVDPNNYDLNNVLTSVPVNKFTIQHINIFQTGNIRLQYGQEVYNSLAEAIQAIETEIFVTETNIAENGIFRGYLVIGEGTSSLLNDTKVLFLEVGKFGNVTGSSSAITFAAIIAALGFTPEDVVNKAIDFAILNNTLYPTTFAVNTLVEANKDAYYEHTQGASSVSWVIAHSLGKYPSVTIQDGAGNNIFGEIVYTDVNNLTLNFNTAFAGIAYLN
tara:strand:+ start:4941 stop:6725 length:1785 start_codon:yes stop_codon:yes gene_type:complete